MMSPRQTSKVLSAGPNWLASGQADFQGNSHAAQIIAFARYPRSFFMESPPFLKKLPSISCSHAIIASLGGPQIERGRANRNVDGYGALQRDRLKRDRTPGAADQHVGSHAHTEADVAAGSDVFAG